MVANYLPVGALHRVWRRLIVEEGMAPGDALSVVTSNVAAAAGLRRKGRIAAGLDADLVACDDHWQIQIVFDRGRLMVADGQPVARGMFDQIILEQIG